MVVTPTGRTCVVALGVEDHRSECIADPAARHPTGTLHPGILGAARIAVYGGGAGAGHSGPPSSESVLSDRSG